MAAVAGLPSFWRVRYAEAAEGDIDPIQRRLSLMEGVKEISIESG
jgi:translation elongation factor EF-1beta